MKNLITENGAHRSRLQELLAANSGVVRIASPYVTATGFFSESRARNVQLLTAASTLSIVSGGISLDSLAALIQSGVECRDLAASKEPRLHAKVYIFGDDCAVVTSANFTTSGFDSNIEVGVEVTSGEVAGLVSWFDKLWKNATRLNQSRLDELALQTAALREEFKFLRGCSLLLDGKRTRPPAARAVPSSPRSSKTQYFLCNTNRLHGNLDFENRMIRRRYAAAWEQFSYTSHMEAVKRGDFIFMYANGVGIIAVGIASGGCECLELGRRGRIVDKVEEQGDEWRIPVHWCQPVPATVRVPWPNVRPPTFQNVSGPTWRHQRNAVIQQFIGDPRLIREVGV